MSWTKTMAPIVQKLEVAAVFGGTASWNAIGAAALSKLIQKMASIIDTEIEARTDREAKPMTDIIEMAPKKGEVWRHTKSGGHYEIMGSTLNTVTDRVDCKYRPLYPCEWQEFNRQIIGHPKAWLTPNADASPRFEKVGVIADARKHPEWFETPE